MPVLSTKLEFDVKFTAEPFHFRCNIKVSGQYRSTRFDKDCEIAYFIDRLIVKIL